MEVTSSLIMRVTNLTMIVEWWKKFWIKLAKMVNFQKDSMITTSRITESEQLFKR